MASHSRVDRLVKALGGEQNLPPTLQQPADIATPAQDETGTDVKQDLQPIDDFLKEKQPPAEGQWWNAKPKIAQIPIRPAPEGRTRITSAGPDSVMKPAPLGMAFCPLLAITKFPYKFVKKEYMQQIATAFFDEGKIWNREWEVYSVWSKVHDTGKPVIFVSESQVMALLDEINTTFPESKVRITESNREEGLVIDFDDISLQELRPHFMGNSTSRDQIESWANSVPLLAPKMAVPKPTLEEFKAKIDAAVEISRNKNKARKEQRHAENLVKRTCMRQMLNRAHRYLGQLGEQDSEGGADAAPLDVNSPSRYLFDHDVIFIAVDVEAHELPPHQITEVGIATLDTHALRSQAPGSNGASWHQHIQARHFRIEEHKSIVNHKFVGGCPENFEFNDGVSTFVQARNISTTVSNCFKPPYLADSPAAADAKPEKRNVVLVGHDINADVEYLRRIGVSLATFPSIIDTVDTAVLYRVHSQEPNPRSLGHILAEFDMVGWNLHNAGNDAVYTLWAMLAVCVESAAEKGSKEGEEKREQKFQARMATAAEQAKERVREEGEGWDSAGDDGGVPIPPGVSVRKDTRPQVLYTAGGNVLDV